MPGETPSGRAKPGVPASMRALCPNLTAFCAEPLTRTMSSSNSSWSSGTSSKREPTLRIFSRSLSAARCADEPAITAWRLLKPPMPMEIAAVSPAQTMTFSIAPPSWSETICASIVLVPWPIAAAPVLTKIFPEPLTRTITGSKGPRPVPFTKFARPKPI